MSENYSLYNLLRYIDTLGRKGLKISKDEFMEQYKGTAKETSMESLFTVFDKCDGKNDGTIDLTSIGMSKWLIVMGDCFFNYDNKTKEIIFSEKKFKKRFGEQISIANFQEALEELKNLFSEKEEMRAKSNLEKEIKDKQTECPDIPEEILAKILLYTHRNSTIKAVNNGYEVVNYDDYDKTTTTMFFNSDGNRVKCVTIYSREYDGDYGNVVSDIAMFDDTGDFKTCIEKYEGGYTWTYDKNYNGFLQYGKNQFAYLPNLEQITVNKGLPNETSFSVTKDDEGNITDILHNNQVLKISDRTKNLLIKLLNNNAVLGLNFDLNVNCNEVLLEIIKDENIPAEAASAIDKLGYEGLLKDKDYKTEFLENGDYVIEYLSNKSRDFLCDKKKTIYSADGSEKAFEIKGNKVFVTENDNIKEYSIEEFLKIIPDESEFVKEEGIVTEEALNYELFKIEDSELAEKLYKVGDRKYISDTEYTQTIGKNTYNIAIIEDKISVKRDGKEFFIDVSGMTQGAKNFIAESNPAALYRLAEKGIKLILEKPPTGGDGEYLPEENIIYIDPEASDIPTLQRRIAHEVGHSYYTHVNPVNQTLEDKFKEESDRYDSEIAAIEASVTPAESAYDALRQFDKWVPENSDARYCATNVYEFVAEAYCLLVTGDAKSEFTIAKVYPEAFELAKKMIEAENN